MSILGETRFTAQQYADFADEIERRATEYARITGRREGLMMGAAAAQAIRNLAPGGRAEQGLVRTRAA